MNHEAQRAETPRHSKALDMEYEVAILTNSNDEPPGDAAAEPANLLNPCQIPRIIYFLTDISARLKGVCSGSWINVSSV